MFQPGQLVKHVARPEWGTGRITEVSPDGKVRVQFSNREGQVLVAHDIAGRVLEPSSDPYVPVTSAVSTLKCQHCKKLLKRSQRSSDRNWKSCPRCSEANGRQHVYYQFPDDFGVSEAREAGGAEDGAQSYCARCRANNPPGTGRLCQAFGAP